MSSLMLAHKQEALADTVYYYYYYYYYYHYY